MTDHTHDDSAIEAYCVRCKERVEMVEPEAVWTSRGTPGTRGECPNCGGTVFRMGATHLHDGMERPQAVVSRNKPPKVAPNTVYIAYAHTDEAIARQLADDLTTLGLTVWLHDHTPEDVRWAGGVHPALKGSARLVLLLSDAAANDDPTRDAWRYFRDKRKPVTLAQLDDTPPPDALRRAPRFDFTTGDYKSMLRQLLQALAH